MTFATASRVAGLLMANIDPPPQPTRFRPEQLAPPDAPVIHRRLLDNVLDRWLMDAHRSVRSRIDRCIRSCDKENMVVNGSEISYSGGLGIASISGLPNLLLAAAACIGPAPRLCNPCNSARLGVKFTSPMYSLWRGNSVSCGSHQLLGPSKWAKTACMLRAYREMAREATRVTRSNRRYRQHPAWCDPRPFANLTEPHRVIGRLGMVLREGCHPYGDCHARVAGKQERG